jgi:peroxiredoxin
MRKVTTLLTALALALTFGAWATLHAAEKTSGGTQIGQTAPNFTLKDQSGKDVKLADYKGKIVVLEWFNDGCPFVQEHYKQQTFVKMNEKYSGKGVVHLAIHSADSSTTADDKAFAEKYKLAYPILSDDGTVSAAYGARSTPHMFIINKDGKLVYKGAIDNDPDGEKPDAERVNYVNKALDELLAGKPVSTPETKSYGCGVHTK